MAKGKEVMGGDYRKLYETVRSVSPPLTEDRPLAEDIQRLAALLQTEEAQRECLAPQEADARAGS
jgi:histidine ammonia-lyase